MTNCKNCNAEISQKFCPNCGQAAQLKRIDSHYIIHEIEHVLHFERGILFTVKELFINPGQNIKKYLSENRSRLIKPIIFIIVTSLIYSLCNSLFHFEDGYINYVDKNNSATSLIFKWIQGHYGYSNIIMGIFIAFWVKLFFKKFNYNIFEILILLCFVMGIGMLIFALLGIIQSLIHTNQMQLTGIAGIIYTTWAIGQFFDKSKATSYVKAFFAYLLGMLTFALVAIAIGTIVELIYKH